VVFAYLQVDFTEYAAKRLSVDLAFLQYRMRDYALDERVETFFRRVRPLADPQGLDGEKPKRTTPSGPCSTMFALAARDLTVLVIRVRRQPASRSCPAFSSRRQPAEFPHRTYKALVAAPVAPRVCAAHPVVRSAEAAAAGTRPSGHDALDKVLQCPFQFFAIKTLGIREWPDAPEERFNSLVQGIVAHAVLKEREINTETLAAYSVSLPASTRTPQFPEGYRAERLRRQIKIALERYLEGEDGLGGETVETEWPFELPLDDALIVTGKIDRIDRLPDGRGGRS